MAVRRVYGSFESPETLKVLACLFEHDLEFEFVHINLKNGDHKKQPFLSMSPFGQVPVFEDGGFKQFESRAIIRSMAHEYYKKGGLVNWDGKKQAIISNWIEVEDHQFEPLALKLIHELTIEPKNGSAPDYNLVEEAEANFAKVLDIYEARLTKFKYLASDEYTIADMLHLPSLQSLMETPAKKLLDSRPKVHEWCSEILARVAWGKVLDMKRTA